MMDVKEVVAALDADNNKSGIFGLIDRNLKVFQTMTPEGESSWSHTAKVRMDNSKRIAVSGSLHASGPVFREICAGYPDHLPLDTVLSLEQAGYKFNDEKDPLLKAKLFAYLSGMKAKTVFRTQWIPDYGKIVAPNDVFTLLIVDDLAGVINGAITSCPIADGPEALSWIIKRILSELSYYQDISRLTSGKYGKHFLAIAPLSEPGQALQVYGQTAFIEVLTDIINIEGAKHDLGVTAREEQLAL
jgi:hypothetical protein